MNDHPKQWSKWLAWAEFWFNSSYNASIGMSPFRVLYRRESPSIIISKKVNDTRGGPTINRETYSFGGVEGKFVQSTIQNETISRYKEEGNGVGSGT